MTRRTVLNVLSSLLILVVLEPTAFAQDTHESLAVVERADAGHTFYEITGTGFPVGRRVRIDAVNVELKQGNTFVVTATADGFSGVFVGKSASGEYVPVPPGLWKVRAKCGSAVAKAKFTVGRGEGIGAGPWGGQRVGLVVSENGATLEWDCAHGTIDQRIVLDGAGHFDVTGVHVREHGGPIRQGEVDDAHPARYSGSVVDDTMTLTVVVTDSNESLGTYTLVRGATPQVFKCL